MLGLGRFLAVCAALGLHVADGQGYYARVGSSYYSFAYGSFGVTGGGYYNMNYYPYTVIGGGYWNTIRSVSHVTVAGGHLNSVAAPGVSATIPDEGIDGEGPPIGFPM